MPSTLFAFDATGWYVAKPSHGDLPSYLKITSTHFAGLPYKVIENGNDCMKISISNSAEATKIGREDDGLRITTVNGEDILYYLLTKNVSLSKAEAIKMGQNVK